MPFSHSTQMSTSAGATPVQTGRPVWTESMDTFATVRKDTLVHTVKVASTLFPHKRH